jgi:hypothetical protein
MMIDQRNAGASVTPTIDQTYTLDRWMARVSQSSKYSVVRSSDAPTGFINSLLVTSLSSYSVGVNDFFTVNQNIEGLNLADLGWGTANAQPVTLSFWVKSSLTGTFGGAFSNASQAKGYAFTYTINVANTWEQKSVTIVGDTSGTWLTTNGVGIAISFGLGVGSNLSATAGSWLSQLYINSATGATSVVGTSGATLYITGVQLEEGTAASPFENRLYGQELALCQRYYARFNNDGAGDPLIANGYQYATTGAVFSIKFPQTMRVEPTMSLANLTISDNSSYGTAVTSINSQNSGFSVGGLYLNMASNGALFRPANLFIANNTTGFLDLSAEL